MSFERNPAGGAIKLLFAFLAFALAGLACAGESLFDSVPPSRPDETRGPGRSDAVRRRSRSPIWPCASASSST